MAFLEKTIDWANYADSWDKVAFFKEFIQFFGKDELNCVRGILNRKRKKDFTDDADAPRSWKGPRLFTGCNKPPVRSPSKDVIPPGEILPVELVEEIEETENHWTTAYAEDDFVAFDVEAAQRYIKFLDANGKMWTPVDQPLPKNPTVQEKEPMTPKAAYISVVDSKGNDIYSRTVQHLPGTYRVDYWSKTTANISSSLQLKDGTPFQDVVSGFLNIVKGKYIVTCCGGSDFRYLELRPTSLLQFDLQSFYHRPSLENPHKDEPMSLRDIYYYHFGEDFQRGPHNANRDAKATMKIFLDGYCKLNFNQEYDFSTVSNLKKYAQKGLYYCKMKKDFLPLCKCEPCNNVVL